MRDGFMTMLDANTAHLRRQDRDILSLHVVGPQGQCDRNGKGALIVYPFEYGWTVSTSGMLDTSHDRAERVDHMRAEGYSEEFIRMMVHAADNDAVMVRFDADAEYVPGFSTFDENTDEPESEGQAPRI